MLMSVINSFASNEQLGVQRTDAGGDYFETAPGNIPVQDPCAPFLFRVVTFTPPSGYSVKQFDWYVNNVFLRTTNSSTDHTTIALSAKTMVVVCKVVYQNSTGGTITSASPGFEIDGKTINYKLNGPDVVLILTQTPAYSLTGASDNSFLYTPTPGTFSSTWQGPSGWTAGTPTNSGNNITFTTDDYSYGTVTATTVINACGYSQVTTKAVTRSHPSPTFSSSNPIRICGSQSGETVTATFTINPAGGASNYTYTITNTDIGTPDNISFSGTAGQTTLTTTSTSVTLTCTSNIPQHLLLIVIANFPDGATSGANYGIEYNFLWWTPTYTWYGCFDEPGSAVSVVAEPAYQGGYYYWYLDGWLMDQGTYNGTQWFWRGEHTLSVKVATNCGESELFSDMIPTGGCYNTFAPNRAAGSLTVYPNPASSQITVSLKDLTKKSAATTATLKDIREIKVVDKLGNVRKVSRYAPGNKKVQLDLSGMPNDMYILQVSDGINRANINVSKLY